MLAAALTNLSADFGTARVERPDERVMFARVRVCMPAWTEIASGWRRR
jgi:hypothetical protein